MNDQVAAIVLLVLFYGVYYGKLFLQKKQGITTMQLNQQDQGSQKTIAVMMGLATVLVLAAEIAAIVCPVPPLPSGVRILGIGLAALGDFVFLLSVITMGNSWRAGVNPCEKTELITTGIYSISRNPAFLGFDLVYVGILLMFFHGWLLLVTLFAIVMLHLQIIFVEEPFLISVFGEDYLAYQNRVRRYLGRYGSR